MTTLSPITGRPQSQQTNRMAGWVTSSSQNTLLGTVIPPFYIVRAHVHVAEAFNSNGADTLTVGYDTDTDAVVTSIDVSTTGVKSVTLGAMNGYNATARQIEAYYTAGGSAPSTGKALVIVEFFPCPKQP